MHFVKGYGASLILPLQIGHFLFYNVASFVYLKIDRSMHSISIISMGFTISMVMFRAKETVL